MSHRCPLCTTLLPGQSDEPDEWVTGRRWLRDDDGSHWPERYREPRVCTGCGGCHPVDVLRMLEEGWTEEPADRRHKGYLHPPGYQAEFDAWRRAFGDHACDDDYDRHKRALDEFPHEPLKGPPVKFYIAHFDEDQLARLNRLYRDRRGIDA